MSKRILISLLLLLIAAWSASAQEMGKQDFEVVKVAEGIHAFIATEPYSGVVQGNVVLITGEESAMLIDSGQFPSLAERMAAEVKKITQKPVRLLVNTHWHGDHLLANHVFRIHFPALMVLTHEETNRNGTIKYEKYAEQTAGYPKLVARLREVSKTGKLKDGTVLTEDQKESLLIDSNVLEATMTDLAQGKYEPAEMTFQKEAGYDLGKRTVRIINLGYGNTAGDAVIFVPDAKVLITGDTVVYPTPYSFGSYHGEWIKVLNKMMELGADTYIPGHGPVMKDASYIKILVELLEDVRKQVQAAVKENLTLADVRKKVTLQEWETRLGGDNKIRRRAFREFFVEPGIEQAYKEAKGEPITE